MTNPYTAAYERFLDKLRDARNTAGLTQSELAARLEKHQTWVSKVEMAQRELAVLDFLTWAKEVGADPLELLQELAREVQESKPKRRRARL